MDELDIADEETALSLAEALRLVRAQRFEYPAGECLNCGESVLTPNRKAPPVRRFCDGDCSKDWERRTRLEGGCKALDRHTKGMK